MEQFKKPRGTEDIIFSETRQWQIVEEVIKDKTKLYNFNEIRTPIFEATNLYVRGVGDTSDVVSKEMYTFNDRKERSLTLRPEGTAGVIRAYLEHKMFGNDNQPVKLYYTGPMFRYERPQKGRQRQFHQFGVETIGHKAPQIDAEVIALGLDIISTLGIKNIKVLINSLGDKQSRLEYREVLIDYFKKQTDNLCNDCLSRLEKNPLRILDCKVDSKKDFVVEAPLLIDYLNEESRTYFNEVLSILDDLKVTYEIDHRLVRGLDYYTDTIFEVVSLNKESGAQATIFGGGRYDGLVASLGGPEISGIGFGLGLERLISSLNIENPSLFKEDNLDIYVMPLDKEALTYSFKVMQQLRSKNIKADMDFENKSMKAKYNYCARNKVPFALLIGSEEVKNNSVTLKNLNTNESIVLQENWLTLVEEGIKNNDKNAQ